MNGRFDDDYPYGLVDPLGWDGKYTDPWTTYGKGGATSYKLFIPLQKPKQETIASTGGTLTTDDEKVKIVVPNNASTTGFSLHFKYGPFESFSSNGKSFKSVAPSFFLDAINLLGDNITQFYEPIRIVYYYSQFEPFNIRENTLILRYFNEVTQNWEPLPSIVDTTNNTVTAETTHNSHFALMGEVKDTVPPQTEIIITGDKGQEDWYRSDVAINLQATDPPESLGLEYTLYSLDDADWQIYTAPLIVATEGKHIIEYQSVDKVGNESERETKNFFIDKTPPEAGIVYDLSLFDSKVTGKDSSGSATVTDDHSRLYPTYTVTDQAGNTLIIHTNKIKLGKQVLLTIESLQYNENQPIPLDKNIFFTLALTNKSNILNRLDQYYSLKGDKKIFTKYLQSTGKTEIYTRAIGENYEKEEKEGIILLQLLTENGTLKYRY